MANNKIYPWALWFRRAIALGIRGHDFWTLSLTEWSWLINDQDHNSALTRNDLDRLTQLYPD